MHIRFGPFTLDPERFELRRGERPLEVQPKVLALIVYLVRNRDRLVGQDELFAAIWPGTAVSPASITRAISIARRILGDSASDAHHIQTVARRGYRFVAPVEGETPTGDFESGTHPYVGRHSLVADRKKKLRFSRRR